MTPLHEIVDRIWTRSEYLLPYARKWTASEQDAEDIVVESLMRGVDKIDNFQVRHNIWTDLDSWLRRICYSRAMNLYNRNKRRGVFTERAGILQLTCWTPDRYENKIIRDAIEDLLPERRAVIFLKYYRDYSYSEIAEELDIPIGTVMSRLYRAKEDLACNELVLAASKDIP